MYINWTKLHERALDQHYSKISALLRFATYIDNNDMQRVSLKTHHRELRLDGNEVYNFFLRFPEDDIYVCLEQQTEVAKTLKDIELSMRNRADWVLVTEKMKSLHEIAKRLEASAKEGLVTPGVYQRPNFESYYGLIWQEGGPRPSCV